MNFNDSLIDLNDDKYCRVFDIVPVSIISLDENAMISYVNKAAQQMIEKKQDDIIGKHFGDGFNCTGSVFSRGGCGNGPNCSDCKIRIAIRNAFVDGKATDDIELSKKLIIDGKETDFWFKTSATPLLVDNKRNVILTLINITVEKNEELELIHARDYSFNLLAQIPSLIWVLNANMECVYVNAEWESFTGFKSQDVLGLGLAKVVHQDDIETCKKAVNDVSKKMELLQIEIRIRRFDGVYRWCLVKGTIHYDINGKYAGYIGTITDITEHKKFEESLEKYKILADNAHDIVLFIDLEGNIIEANIAAVNAYGYTYEELCLINIRNIRSDWGYTKEQMKKADQEGIFFEATHRRKDGSYFAVEVSSKGSTIDGKRILLSIVRDITERKLAEEKVKEKEELFRTVFEQSPIAIAFCSSNYDIYDVNPMYEQLFARSKDELRRLGWDKITHPDDINKDMINFSKYVSGESNTFNAIKRYVKPNGSIVWGSLRLAPLKLRNNIHMNLSMIEDITERVEMDQALKDINEKQKAMIENISDIIAIVDDNMVIKYISSNITKWFGWPTGKVLYSCFLSLVHPDDIIYAERELSNLLKRKFEDLTFEFRYRCRNNEYKIVEAIAKNLIDDKHIRGILINYRDITIRKAKEEEILYLNQYDTLSGLFNRRYFDTQIRWMDAVEKLPLSIIMGDINGLKMINEAYGNSQGDKLIKNIADNIKKCLEKHHIVARTGGGDFKILLPNTGNSDANDIMKKIESLCNDNNCNTIYQTSFSLGCATKVDMNEPFDGVVKLAEDNMHHDKLLHKESMQNSLIMSLKSTLFEKSQETEEHAERLVRLSKALGRILNLTDDKMNELELLSTLHDIGKIGVKDSILEKRGKLTDDEWNQIMRHSVIGYRIAKSIPILQPIAEYILHHHERYDGKGYPQNLKGEEIPLLSRIITVVDSYDAMTSERVYKKAMTKEAAIEEMRNNMGLQFDPEIAGKFIEYIAYLNL